MLRRHTAFVMTQTDDPAAALACRALVFMLVMTAIDLGVVAVTRAMGGDVGFVPLRHDLFGDFFKLILSYPGGRTVPISDLFGLHNLLARYRVSDDYSGVEGFTTGHLTHLHVTPLTAAFCLVALRAMAWIDPVILFAASLLALAGWWLAIVRSHAAGWTARVAWAAMGFVCYPTALLVVRGNLYAGVAGLLVIQAMLRALERRDPARGAAMLAIACCIRPNAVLFLVPLLLLASGGRIRALVVFTVVGAATSIAALGIAHALYPPYTLGHFHTALASYYDHYVRNDMGVAYGSSAFGGLKLLFGYRPALDAVATAPTIFILVTMAALVRRGGLRPSSLIFLTMSAYTLGSTILADYHLLPFLLAPIALARETPAGTLDPRARAILFASCLMLVSKNFACSDAASWQGIINPLVLIAASFQVLTTEWRSAATPWSVDLRRRPVADTVADA